MKGIYVKPEIRVQDIVPACLLAASTETVMMGPGERDAAESLAPELDGLENIEDLLMAGNE